MSDLRGKIIDFMAEAKKRGGQDRETGAVSVVGNGNVVKNLMIGGDYIVNQKGGPSYVRPPELSTEELKAIQDLVYAIDDLELLAKKNRIASPKGLSFSPQARTARPAIWKRFNDQFILNEYKALPRVKYERALKFLLGWKTALENLLAKRLAPDARGQMDRAVYIKKIFGRAKSRGWGEAEIRDYCVRKYGATLSNLPDGDLIRVLRYLQRPV